jgi:hypothetical protein
MDAGMSQRLRADEVRKRAASQASRGHLGSLVGTAQYHDRSSAVEATKSAFLI